MNENLSAAFQLMGQGMLAIFIVMASIALIVYFLTKFSGNKKDETKQ